MIGFALRLTVRGGRESVTRLAVICAGVAVGVALLLATLAGLNAVHKQNDRFAWLETGAKAVAGDSAQPGAGVDPLWWLLTADEFAGKQIGRLDLAPTGPNSPVPPGLPRLPRPGEYYASPALARLLARTPADELAARYPGNLAGTIGSAGLPSPDSLIVVVDRPAAALATVSGAEEVTHISTTPPNQCNGACVGIGFNENSIVLILAVVAAAILFPVLIFIASATRLSAARRNQRFAALRLVGATPRQVAVISAVESTLASVIGVALGFGLFAALRSTIADVPFTGSRFFPADLSLSVVDVVGVAVGIPLAAAVAARLALRRVIISPLGVTRRVTPHAPSAWRLLLPLAGIAELAVFVIVGRPSTTDKQILAYLPGVMVTMLGLVVAGPWLTFAGSRLVARRAQRPAALIAARRLADNPQAGFRAVSGLVLSLFVATLAFAVIAGFQAHRAQGTAPDTATERGMLVDDLTDFTAGQPTAPVPAAPPGVEARIAGIPGVEAVTEVHAAPDFGSNFQLDGVVTCAALAQSPVLGRCPSGAASVRLSNPGFGDFWLNDTSRRPVWPDAGLSAAAVNSRPLITLIVNTDGSVSAIERARTMLEGALPTPDGFAPVSVSEQRAQSSESQRAAGYQRLADVVILTSLPIAGCTIAVGALAGLNDRRRAFSLLRLTGAPISVLRRVVTLEAAVPLLATAVLSPAAAFLAAYLFMRSQLGESLVPPGIGYYATFAAGVIASLAIIASTLPVLDRFTGPEAARND